MLLFLEELQTNMFHHFGMSDSKYWQLMKKEILYI